MNTKMKANKKMVRGFMCHSPAATAVCMTGDHRSVIVPRRPDRTLVDHGRLINTAKYTRIVERRRHHMASTTSTKRSSTANVVPSHKTTTNVEAQVKKDDNNIPQLPLSNNVVQEVVMRVSLHCHGCAGKVKKLLSKMEGVTSYTVDLETKRVTVMGHVSPVCVLESISKVKKAEFWPC